MNSGITLSSNRFLFIVETSSAMKNFRDDEMKIVGDILVSSANAQMRVGDSVGLWTFNEEVYSDLPAQAWTADNHDEVIRRTLTFLQNQHYGKSAKFNQALSDMQDVIHASDIITVILVSSGHSKITGTPFDKEINTLCKETLAEMKRSPKPVVTVLQARQGKIVRYTVSAPPWPVVIPEVPIPIHENTTSPKTSLNPPEPNPQTLNTPPPATNGYPPGSLIVSKRTPAPLPRHPVVSNAPAVNPPPAPTPLPTPAPTVATSAPSNPPAPPNNLQTVSPPTNQQSSPPVADTPPTPVPGPKPLWPPPGANVAPPSVIPIVPQTKIAPAPAPPLSAVLALPRQTNAPASPSVVSNAAVSPPVASTSQIATSPTNTQMAAPLPKSAQPATPVTNGASRLALVLAPSNSGSGLPAMSITNHNRSALIASSATNPVPPIASAPPPAPAPRSTNSLSERAQAFVAPPAMNRPKILLVAALVLLLIAVLLLVVVIRRTRAPSSLITETMGNGRKL
jgi:hypothetical protein